MERHWLSLLPSIHSFTARPGLLHAVVTPAFPLSPPQTAGPAYHSGNGVAVCSEFQVWKVPLSLLAYLLACPLSLWVSWLLATEEKFTVDKVELFCHEKELWVRLAVVRFALPL